MNIQSFLKKKKTVKNYNPSVPSGLIAHTDKGYFYIKGNKKFKFVSERAMLSWSLPIVKTNDVMLNKLITSGTLGFRDGTLVKDISDGKIYLISDSKRRHIIEPNVLEWIEADIIKAGQKEILVHTEGEPLDGNNN
jgi:hypothetical protein